MRSLFPRPPPPGPCLHKRRLLAAGPPSQAGIQLVPSRSLVVREAGLCPAELHYLLVLEPMWGLQPDPPPNQGRAGSQLLQERK